jgi:hypothetical protein
VQPKSSSVWHTGLSGGAPDSVRCARLDSGKKAALGKCSAAYGYNSPDFPVSQRSPAQWSAAQSAGDVWPVPTVGRGTRMSGVPTAPGLKRPSAPEKERDRHRTIYNDCPVRKSTEGKDGLLCLPPTTPSCLGAIKGTPRRM